MGGIAAIQAMIETDTDLKSSIEYQISVIDTRRMVLARKASEASATHCYLLSCYSNYENKKDSGIETTKKEDERWGAFDEEQFELEYELLNTEIDCQDKALESQKTTLQTQLSAVTTRLESNQKQLNQNIEKDYNYIK